MAATDAPDPDAVPSRFRIDFEGRTLLGTYRVERKLADGGMGSVYLAQDTNLGRRVVVKVPHVRFLGEEGFRARFRREVAELVRLEHPHVVRILAQGEEDEIPFFVLQYLGGGSLEDRLKQGLDTPESAFGWFEAIAKTLDFVHGRGVVHRDVKPANILFDEQGHVFLSDFGVVKALKADDAPDLTEVGTGVGSPFYMAPEQALGRGVSATSDQYALASTLYEALAGSPPYGKTTLLETVLRKDKEDAPPIRGAVPSVPEACERAIARALSRDPVKRFASCGEFVEAYRVGIAEALAPPATRLKRPVIVLAGLAAIVLAAGIGVATGWLGPRRTPDTPPGPVASPGAGRILAQLVNPGAEPRRTLRLRLVADTRETTHSFFEMKTVVTRAGGMPQHEGLILEHDIDVHVTTVRPDGTAQLEWLFHTPRTRQPGGTASPDSGGKPADVGSRPVDLGEALGDVVGTSLVDARGFPSEVVLAPVKKREENGVDVSTVLERYVAMARESFPTLPEEPVGVGAEWDVTELAQGFGMRYQQTTSYTLLESDADRVKLLVRQVYTAPTQGFLPGFRRDMPEMTVRSFNGSGKGEMVVELGRAMPLRTEAKESISMEMTISLPGRGQLMNIENGLVIRGERK